MVKILTGRSTVKVIIQLYAAQDEVVDTAVVNTAVAGDCSLW